MMISVKLFAAAREAAGAEQVELEFSEAPTIADVRCLLVARYPALEVIVPHAMFAVNTDYASDQTRLSQDDEIACIPPVSGG